MKTPAIGSWIGGVKVQPAVKQSASNFDGNVGGGILHQVQGSPVVADNCSTVAGDGAFVVQINAAVIGQRLDG